MKPEFEKCHFCQNLNIDVKREGYEAPAGYFCKRCGYVNFDEEAAGDFYGENISEKDRKIFSIWNRNQFESRGRKSLEKKLDLGDLCQIVKQYTPLQPLEKMDNALLNIDKASEYFGHSIRINIQNDYPYYHCDSDTELLQTLIFLRKENFIECDQENAPTEGLRITPKGYQRLRELKKPGKDSNQCFVAMWFDQQLDKAFEGAIKPGVEFEDEEREKKSGFEAIRVDRVRHTNDINNEVIAQIRKSRFMVCDLTGYRGGVYFEAGFAHGLGLQVINTCRKDWIKEKVTKIIDQTGIECEIKQEGIHFDLEHRNRIAWEDDTDEKLKKFREELRWTRQALIF